MKNLTLKWGSPTPQHATVRKANVTLFSIDAVKETPIETNPIMQQAIKQTHEMGYESNNPLYIDICQQIYNNLSKETQK